MKFFTDEFIRMRKLKRYTASDLCRELVIGRTTLWAWETGKRVPSEKILRRLAKILDVPLDHISDLPHEQPLSKENLDATIQESLRFSTSYIEEQKNELISKIVTHAKSFTQTSFIIQALLSSIPAICYIKNKNLKYITANVPFLKTVSLDKTYDVSGKTDHTFFTNKEAEANTAQDKEVLLTGIPVVNYESNIPGTKKKRYGLISKHPIRDTYGHVSGLIGIFLDITEQKNEQEERELLEICVNNMTDGIVIREAPLGNYLYMNQVMEQITGYPRDFFLKEGNKFFLNEYIHPDDRKMFEYVANGVIAHPHRKRFRIIRSDKSIRWLEGTTSPHTIFKNKQCYIVSIKDITDQKNAKETKILEIAKSLKNQGIDIKVILKATGLTQKEVMSY
ncbi:MAG TPA: PAS domain S-box protein [Victivallales bacterium]|nr:PAS domain S-box protein [Victivallales bacterium]